MVEGDTFHLRYRRTSPEGAVPSRAGLSHWDLPSRASLYKSRARKQKADNRWGWADCIATHDFCPRPRVGRLLLLLRGTIDEAAVRRCCSAISWDQYEAVAIYYELPPLGQRRFFDGLAAQQRLTAILRHLLGAEAEQIAIFVGADQAGERSDDYARGWGATVVRA